MDNAIIPYFVEKDLPFSVSSQLQQMPEEAQKDFLTTYSRREKNVVLAYVFHLVFPVHYLYLDKILLQIIYWITFGGFGLWWFVDLFRIPSMVRERNKEIADETLKKTWHKFKLSNVMSAIGLGKGNAKTEPLKPRDIEVVFDPTHPELESLKAGFLIDYQGKTWRVISETQYDWDGLYSEKEFRLSKIDDTTDTLYLNIKRENGFLNCYTSLQVNLYSIDSQIDRYIQDNQNPQNVLKYGDFNMYREGRLQGFVFNQPSTNAGRKATIWDYYDNARNYRLRIEQHDATQFRATFGKPVNSLEFTEMLPSGN